MRNLKIQKGEYILTDLQYVVEDPPYPRGLTEYKRDDGRSLFVFETVYGAGYIQYLRVAKQLQLFSVTMGI